jgi:hypothetical protein
MKGDGPPVGVSAWLKEIATASIELRFRIGAKHIHPGTANCLADALRRRRYWSKAMRYLARWKRSQSDDWIDMSNRYFRFSGSLTSR